MSLDAVKALTFDVFGTVVDWRSSIVREGEALGRAKGLRDVDWTAFADAWRGLYQPAMERVRSGQTQWTTAELLGLRPAECLMVAAHNGDLIAAGGLGFRTAFVFRRTEHGPKQTTDLAPSRDFDVVAEDFLDLAVQLGA